jgi:hypothetical protein
MIGFDPDFDYLYDPQQMPPVGFCVCCGREIYVMFRETCERCQADTEDEE